VQSQEVVLTQHAIQANTARVASAVEGQAQGSVLMGERVQAILETQRAMAEDVAGILEAHGSTAMGIGGMWETLLAMAVTLAGILETQQAVAMSFDNLSQSHRAKAEELQCLARSQNAVAEVLQSLAQSQRARVEGIQTMGQMHLGLLDWQSQVTPELPDLSPATLVFHGVSPGPLGSSREEEGFEPMPGPSTQEIPDIPRPSDFPLPHTGHLRTS